jgi:hypothetical protein
MRHGKAGDSIALRAVWIGVAIPFLYYGSQAFAAPFFPGFTFVGTTASELGSDLSRHPRVFNYGIMAQGVVALVASLGFLLAFRRLGVHWPLAWPTSLSVAMSGVQSLWAGYFPLLDPRHGGHPAFLIPMIALPSLLAASTWKIGSGASRAYFLANLGLLAVMFPIMSGITSLDTQAYRGLSQRMFAFTVFPAIGVASFVLARRVDRS